jgi:DNA invertase Pin-like site-specific DNA recombinase
MKKLRFAPLIRVSTEGQAAQGESLRTQKKQILQYVELLNGTIPDSCWKYSGQEHATPEFERKKLDALLSDSSKDIFDAIIVCDASRWSRDNLKSKKGLEILRLNECRFYVGTTEYDLFNPEQSFFLGLAAEIGEFQASSQALKSIVNRINRAKRGIPASGSLPYGRTFDRKTDTWGIDKEKQKNIQWAAERYLAGQSMADLAVTLNINHASLWKTLTHRSGTEWPCRFRNKKLNIDESVIIEIPELLPQSIIDQIHKKSKANKTYTHGQTKHKYLLGRMIFCEDCGYAMFGQTNHGEKRYYRHARNRVKECDPSFWVRAADIEEAVMVQLYSMYGDKAKLETAMLRAIPNPERIEKLEDEKEKLDKRQSQIKNQISNVIDMVADGIINGDETRAKMEKLRNAESTIIDRLRIVKPQLATFPTSKMIQSQASRIKRALHSQYTRPGGYKKMTWKAKRHLAQTAFDGEDLKGKRCGVYMSKDTDGNVTYTVRGVLPDLNTKGSLPMDKDTKEYVLGGGSLSPKVDYFSKCHAYYRFSFYQ